MGSIVLVVFSGRLSTSMELCCVTATGLSSWPALAFSAPPKRFDLRRTPGDFDAKFRGGRRTG